MNILNMVLTAALAASTGIVFAHGEEAHDSKAAATMPKEQTAWGIAGDAKAAKRTIELTMSDTMRFSPEKIEVRQGETVRFVLKNNGNILHEMVIGDKKTLDEHAVLMLKFPNMEHDEPYMAHVAPGKSGVMIWRFNRVGNFDFACLVAGHYQAGMRGTIRVARAAPPNASK